MEGAILKGTRFLFWRDPKLLGFRQNDVKSFCHLEPLPVRVALRVMEATTLRAGAQGSLVATLRRASHAETQCLSLSLRPTANAAPRKPRHDKPIHGYVFVLSSFVSPSRASSCAPTLTILPNTAHLTTERSTSHTTGRSNSEASGSRARRSPAATAHSTTRR